MGNGLDRDLHLCEVDRLVRPMRVANGPWPKDHGGGHAGARQALHRQHEGGERALGVCAAPSIEAAVADLTFEGLDDHPLDLDRVQVGFEQQRPMLSAALQPGDDIRPAG
jgi:hypothetical protein